MTTEQPVFKAVEPNPNQLHEAPAVAWTNVFSKTGAKINITVRSTSATEALDELVEAVLYAKEKYNFEVMPHGAYVSTNGASAPASDVPQAQPVQTSNGEVVTAQTKTIAVETISKGFTPNGKEYLLVKGNPFSKYGVKAWPETVPDTIDFAAMEAGKEYTAGEGMRQAVVVLNDKGNPQKVVSFIA